MKVRLVKYAGGEVYDVHGVLPVGDHMAEIDIPEPKSPGEIAFEAYQQTPPAGNMRWEECAEYQRAGWESAARAVINSLKGCPDK